jgi:membrane-associated protease RseP (regulator of RpoE activity)
MLKFLLTACLICIGFLSLSAIGGQRSGVSSDPLLLAMQKEGTDSQEPASAPALANNGWIGVSLEDANGQEVHVKDVFPAGPAAFAGVRVGDVLLKIGGANVDSRDAAQAAIERLVPRRQVSVTIRRHGKAVELKITPDSLADFRQRYISEMVRRDPRDPKYGQRHGVSDADMHVELIRRLFEQNQRMESSLHELTREVQSLRKEVRALQK